MLTNGNSERTLAHAQTDIMRLAGGTSREELKEAATCYAFGLEQKDRKPAELALSAAAKPDSPAFPNEIISACQGTAEQNSSAQGYPAESLVGNGVRMHGRDIGQRR